MGKKLKIAIIVPDNRDEFRCYEDPAPYFGTAPTALLDGFTLLADECEIHVVNCVQRPLSTPEKIAPNIFCHTAIVPKWGWLRGGYLGCIHAVRRMLKKVQPDIVHGQGTERYCAISAAFSGYPNVITIHGNMRAIARIHKDGPFSFNTMAARLEGFVLPRTNGVVCITNYTRQAVASTTPRTWVIPNAVDMNFFNVQAEPNLSVPPSGLCVGTICSHKNQNAFIKALDPLAFVKKIKIIFAGGATQNAYSEEFQKLIRERSWCEHIGFINREQLKARLASATFLALPTREDNCPMVVLEAMAAGVPTMASNIGGVPDLIEHEVNGLLCDPEQPETFRAGVTRLLEDHTLAKRIADTAKNQARLRFHPQVIAEKHLEIYREVLSKP